MDAEIIIVGDEILIGQIADTNSGWISRELNREGFSVRRVTVVADCQEQICEALASSLSRADVVLITGGLGPTGDDVTLKALCGFFQSKLIFSPEVYHAIENVLSAMGESMNEPNRLQAYVPEKCIPIQNLTGTAPACWFEKDGKVTVSMPGVPYEMECLMENEVIPRLKRRFIRDSIRHRHALIYGYAESELSVFLKEWENKLPDFIQLAYLPSYGFVQLRLTGKYPDEKLLEQVLDAEMERLRERLGKAIVSEDDVPLEVLVGRLLESKGLTLSTAESCTGGNIAHRITSVAGSSAYFKGSVVAYSNEVKKSLLKVPAKDIDMYGAVSQQVVVQMVRGALLVTGADIAIATSGVAGPTGGTPEKPVGTVWIAVGNAKRVVSRLFRFGQMRELNIRAATISALVLLKEFLAYEDV